MSRRPLLVLALIAAASALAADDARALSWGDSLSAAAEEAYIERGLDPPFLERPSLVGRLARVLGALPGSPGIDALLAALEPPARPVFLHVATAAAGLYNGSPYRNASFPQSRFTGVVDGEAVFSSGGRSLWSVESMSSALATPPLLDISLSLVAGPVALELNPELRPASNFYRNEEGAAVNLLLAAAPELVDPNVPYRGLATFLSGPIELRAGRDKLHFGPSPTTGLSFNAAIPWADYVSARADAGPLSLSWYLVRLNPYMTDDERYYLDAIYDDPSLNPDQAASYELIQRESQKHLAVCRLTWRIAPWITLALTQHDLVGGRSIQLPDLNPLIVWHDLFQEGVYGVPAMAELSLTPIPGLRLYGEYLLYDAMVADEVGSDSGNAGASAYLAGASAVIRPFAAGALPGGRLRLDAEALLADPWVYGKYFSLRQFTSRFVFVEPYNGRFWVDYPIGPSTGPDCFTASLRAALGSAAGPELALKASYLERGSIDLLGYGEGSDYARKDEYHRSGLVFVKDGEVPERRLAVGIEGKAPLGSLARVLIEAAGSIEYTRCLGYGFSAGDERDWAVVRLGATARFR